MQLKILFMLNKSEFDQGQPMDFFGGSPKIVGSP
jgi:hypothetical protein